MATVLLKLSAWVLLLCSGSTARADSFLMPVQSSVCTNMTENSDRDDIRGQTYDKAVFQAIRSSAYIRAKAAAFDDHTYNLLAYRLADKALNDVTVKIVRDDEKKVCIKINANLDTEIADELIKNENRQALNPEKVKKIAHEINSSLPKSIFETDSTIPLLYIKDVEFYNNKTSSRYTADIARKLSFEPRVLITEHRELADYFLVPKLLLSKMEKIDDKNSKYSMSVVVELQNGRGETIETARQNRYIIVSNADNRQEIAHKLLLRLLEDAVTALSEHLNVLLKE